MHSVNDTLARRNMRFAITSACWGQILIVIAKDSSIIIILASMIGAGDSVAVFTTAITDAATCLLLLLFAALSNRVGLKQQTMGAHVIMALSFVFVALAPWLGPAAAPTLLLALLVFAIAQSGYMAAWFPMLDEIVPAGERALFFGRLRVAWQLIAAGFVLLSGWFLGRHATVGRLQLIIAAAAVVSLGRLVYIARIQLPDRPPQTGRIVPAVLESLRNRTLTGFSIYLFFLYLAANGTIPVVFVFGRNYLHLPDNIIVILSAVVMVGLLLGFLAGGRVVHHLGAKRVLVSVHIGFALLNLALLALHAGNPQAALVLGLILGLYGALFACASIAVTSELMALALPQHKAVSLAFGLSLYTAGMAGSRLLASFLLGTGLLAEQWTWGTRILSRYHSLFLLAAAGVVGCMLLLIMVPGMVRYKE